MAAIRIIPAMRVGSAVYVGSTLVPVALMAAVLPTATAMHPNVVMSTGLLK